MCGFGVGVGDGVCAGLSTNMSWADAGLDLLLDLAGLYSVFPLAPLLSLLLAGNDDSSWANTY